MNSIEKYNEAFKEALGVKEEQLDNLEYQSIKEWDSVGHMALMASLEETYDIMMDTDDIIDFNSYIKGKEILRKYDIEF